jgi:hypothetical protein
MTKTLFTKRLDKLEAHRAFQVWQMVPGRVSDVAAAKLSLADRELLAEAQEHRYKPECPEHLQAIWDRWRVAVDDANRELGVLCPIVVDDWNL